MLESFHALCRLQEGLLCLFVSRKYHCFCIISLVATNQGHIIVLSGTISILFVSLYSLPAYIYSPHGAATILRFQQFLGSILFTPKYIGIKESFLFPECTQWHFDATALAGYELVEKINRFGVGAVRSKTLETTVVISHRKWRYCIHDLRGLILVQPLFSRGYSPMLISTWPNVHDLRSTTIVIYSSTNSSRLLDAGSRRVDFVLETGLVQKYL